jgi:hypothetical protein
MQFVYKPEGADVRRWDFAPEKLMNVESEAIERVTKMTYTEWAGAVERGSVTALHALLWVMLKRGEPTLTYEAVQFSLSEVDFELSDEESVEALAAMDARIAEGAELSTQERALHAALREAVAKAPSLVAVRSESEESDGGPKEALPAS